MKAPSHEEVKVTIMRFKSFKSAGYDGLAAELFKTEGNELVGRMRRLIYEKYG